MQGLLATLGLIDPAAVVPFGCCRDRDDIAVLRCPRSGLIFLADSGHAGLSYYEAKDDDVGTTVLAGERLVTPVLDDARRRADTVGALIHGARWLDVGSGDGGVLDLLAPQAASATGVEPNPVLRAATAARGHTVHRSVEELGGATFQVITLFHVFEHLPDPIGTLRALRQRLEPGGRILIEVPHARDALLTLYDCDAFRRFTLWSEHLILHTRTSLAAFMTAAGCREVVVKGMQRYPLANHLYWLRHGRPGGHKAWHALDGGGLADSYEATLQSMDATDTLLGLAQG